MLTPNMPTPGRMLTLIALAQFLGMTLWFSATAAAPAIAAVKSQDTGDRY
jgi:hypothetical protein